MANYISDGSDAYPINLHNSSTVLRRRRILAVLRSAGVLPPCCQLLSVRQIPSVEHRDYYRVLGLDSCHKDDTEETVQSIYQISVQVAIRQT